MIHDVGKGQSYGAKYTALVEAKTAAIPFTICPTRRKPIAYPAVENALNSAPAGVLNKTDYAANGGSVRFLGAGPPFNDVSGTPYSCSCFSSYPACKWSNSDGALLAFNGVSGERSEVQQIPDGQSNVFLAGEKSLDPNIYYTGSDGADNDSCLEGNDWDVNRWVANGSTPFAPHRDTPGVDDMSSCFGSAHAQGLHFVFCDGHVQLISYQIDMPTYQSLGVRNDGTYSENY